MGLSRLENQVNARVFIIHIHQCSSFYLTVFDGRKVKSIDCASIEVELELVGTLTLGEIHVLKVLDQIDQCRRADSYAKLQTPMQLL